MPLSGKDWPTVREKAPDKLREWAVHARSMARALPDYDPAQQRLRDLSEELEAEAARLQGTSSRQTREFRVAEYRLYGVTADDLLSGPSLALTCNSDEEAIDAAAPLLKQHPIVEIWRGRQLVRRLQRDP